MWSIGWQLFDTMLIANPEGDIFPSLFDAWEVADDSVTYTFMLHPDVTFHDGSPWNAEAAKYNFDRVVDPDTGSILWSICLERGDRRHDVEGHPF